MAEERYKAELEGIELEIQDISDVFEVAIARYEHPYAQGARLENMGQKARGLRFRCFFYGSRYQDHLRLLELLNETENRFELLHPQYGPIRGWIDKLDLRHDDRRSTAEIDISFTEHRRSGKKPVLREEVAGKTENLFREGMQNQRDELELDLRNDLGAEAGQAPDRTLDPANGILEQFPNITGTARTYLKKIDQAAGVFESYLNEVTAPAGSLIASIDFATDLPGRVLGAMARAAEKQAVLSEKLKTSPARFLRSFRDGMTKLEQAAGLSARATGVSPGSQTSASAQSLMKKHLAIAGAQVAALELGGIYADDELGRQQLKNRENSGSFDDNGNYLGSVNPPPILTIDEIENSLAASREYLQQGIDQAREIGSLRELAASLARHVNEIKLERERIVTIFIDHPTPLHLVCLRNGLPYNMAERILAINPRIANPGFAQGEVRIYAA